VSEQGGAGAVSFPVNILFHGIGRPRREMEDGEDRYWIDRGRFEAILDEVATWPQLSLSVDDGNASDVEIALPALLDRGLSADFFVLAGRLGEPGSLGEDDLDSLIKNGMTVGTHGMVHRPWRRMDAGAIREELVVARDRLASVTGQPVTQAACPLGQYDRGCLNALRRLDYTTVFTSDRRPARPGRWLQPRFSVRCEDTPETLRGAVLHSRQPSARARASAVGIVKRWR
jgi:peptidoglycan/xylan/chitin deacetylase (PgdA/CDA1 family)